MAGRIRCPYCGTLLPQGAQVCRNCMKPLQRTDSNPYRKNRPGSSRTGSGPGQGSRTRSSSGAGRQTGTGHGPGSRTGTGPGPLNQTGTGSYPGRGYYDLESARMEENGLGSDWHQSWDREDVPDPDRMTAGQWILVVLLLVLLVFLVFLGIYWFFLR